MNHPLTATTLIEISDPRATRAAARHGAALALTISLAMLTSLTGSARPALAQSGIQVTPDGARTLVSKDIAGQRWAITRNSEGTVTGNVFSPSGGPPQFVWCQQTGTAEGGVAFSCSGSEACLVAPCDPEDWVFIADVVLPESFFAVDTAQSLALPTMLEEVPTLPMVRFATARPAGTSSSGSASGLQITPDGARTLLSKDVGDQRWAISRNEDGTATGNVFFPGGGEPQFVWCEQTGESRDSVALRCLGTTSCARDGSTPCNGAGWALIAEVSLPLSFFTPARALDEDALAARVIATLGEDGAFEAVARALERGYSLAQIVDAALENRLRVSGEVVDRSGTTETPSGPPLDLFTDEGSTADVARPAATSGSIGQLLEKFKNSGTAAGKSAFLVFVALLDAGYTPEQIIVEVFLSDTAIRIDNGKIRLADESGNLIKPDGEPLGIFETICGNGRLDDDDEECDGALFGNLYGDCADGLPGNPTCTADCTVDYSTCTIPAPVCGDSKIEGSEQCEGTDVGAKTCAEVGGSSSLAPACVQCRYDFSVCTASCPAGGFCCPQGKKRCGDECIASAASCCGDGVRQGSEQCEGDDLNGATCASQGEGSGALACTGSCSFDIGGCTGGGTCPGGTFACEGGCAPSGADCCVGEAGYCAPGTVCVGDNACCPSSTPKVCGDKCVAVSAACCGNGAVESGEACDGSAGCDSGAACASDCSVCNSTAVCGNGMREGSEVCDPPGSTASCGSGEVCGADCGSCVSTTSCAGRCCAGRNDSCTPPGVGCYCDQYCLEAGDCCADFGASCG